MFKSFQSRTEQRSRRQDEPRTTYTYLSVATFRQHGSFRPPECQAGFLDGRSLLGVLFVVLGAQRDFCVFFCGSLFNLVLNAHLQSHVFSLELLEVFQFEREDSHVEAQRLSFLRGILENKISK